MADRRPVLFRNGTVLTMDDAHTVLTGGDVLVVDDRIAEVGTGLVRARRRARGRRHRRHRDARHDRHAPAHVADRDAGVRRRLDAHPVLRLVLPRARPAVPSRGHPRRQPAVRRGTPSRPASPPPSTGPTACRPSTTPTRPSTRCRRCRAGSCSRTATSRPAPWEWTADPAVKAFFDRRRSDDDMLGFQIAFDVIGEESFPEGPAFEFARELGLPHTTHAGVWGATNDNGIRLMHENGFMGDGQHLRARRHADRGLLPAHRGVRRLRLGLDGVRAERRPGVPAHLAGTPPRHPGVAVPRHQRVVEQRPVHRHADDARRRPLARAPRGARRRRHGHQLLLAGRAGRRLGDARWRTGARPRRPRRAEPGQEGRRRADQERRLGRSPSRCSTPTATSPSRPSAATCTRWSSTATS